MRDKKKILMDVISSIDSDTIDRVSNERSRMLNRTRHGKRNVVMAIVAIAASFVALSMLLSMLVVLNFVLPNLLPPNTDGNGPDGITVERTGSDGETDIYTITYEDGTQAELVVTNLVGGSLAAYDFDFIASRKSDKADVTERRVENVVIENGEFVLIIASGDHVNIGKSVGERKKGESNQFNISSITVDTTGVMSIGLVSNRKISVGDIMGYTDAEGNRSALCAVKITSDGELTVGFGSGQEINLGFVESDSDENSVAIDGISSSESGEIVIVLTSGTEVNLGNAKKDGEVSISGSSINSDGELCMQYSDGSGVNLGRVDTKQDSDEGIGIERVYTDNDSNLVVVLTNGAEVNIGKITGKNGAAIKESKVNENGELCLTYTDGTEINLGRIFGDGKKGSGVESITLDGGESLVITVNGGASMNLGDIRGEDNDGGKTAFDMYKDKYGYEGDEDDWFSSLIGGTLEVKHKVMFDAAGGSGISSRIVEHGKTIPETVVTRQGYEFIGWFIGDVEWNFETDTVCEDITLTAKWERVVYDIKYQLKGGKNDPSNPRTYHVSEGISLTDPVRDGYVFVGWTYGDVTEPVKSLSLPAGNYGELHFVAHWESVKTDTTDVTEATDETESMSVEITTDRVTDEDTDVTTEKGSEYVTEEETTETAEETETDEETVDIEPENCEHSIQATYVESGVNYDCIICGKRIDSVEFADEVNKYIMPDTFIEPIHFNASAELTFEDDLVFTRFSSSAACHMQIWSASNGYGAPKNFGAITGRYAVIKLRSSEAEDIYFEICSGNSTLGGQKNLTPYVGDWYVAVIDLSSYSSYEIGQPAGTPVHIRMTCRNDEYYTVDIAYVCIVDSINEAELVIDENEYSLYREWSAPPISVEWGHGSQYETTQPDTETETETEAETETETEVDGCQHSIESYLTEDSVRYVCGTCGEVLKTIAFDDEVNRYILPDAIASNMHYNVASSNILSSNGETFLRIVTKGSSHINVWSAGGAAGFPKDLGAVTGRYAVFKVRVKDAMAFSFDISSGNSSIRGIYNNGAATNEWIVAVIDLSSYDSYVVGEPAGTPVQIRMTAIQTQSAITIDIAYVCIVDSISEAELVIEESEYGLYSSWGEAPVTVSKGNGAEHETPLPEEDSEEETTDEGENETVEINEHVLEIYETEGGVQYVCGLCGATFDQMTVSDEINKLITPDIIRNNGHYAISEATVVHEGESVYVNLKAKSPCHIQVWSATNGSGSSKDLGANSGQYIVIKFRADRLTVLSLEMKTGENQINSHASKNLVGGEWQVAVVDLASFTGYETMLDDATVHIRMTAYIQSSDSDAYVDIAYVAIVDSLLEASSVISEETFDFYEKWGDTSVKYDTATLEAIS